jgi:hypothetical protein
MYVITAVPAVMPLTSPRKLTDATADALLQYPPAELVLIMAVLPSHTVPGPTIDVGTGFTATFIVLAQPVGKVYDITVMPGAIPFTIPAPLTVAVAPLLLLQVPPPLALLIPVLIPWHTDDAPTIASGCGSTVIVMVL